MPCHRQDFSYKDLCVNDHPHLFSQPSPKIGPKQQSALSWVGIEPKNEWYEVQPGDGRFPIAFTGKVYVYHPPPPGGLEWAITSSVNKLFAAETCLHLRSFCGFSTIVDVSDRRRITVYADRISVYRWDLPDSSSPVRVSGV